MERDCARAGVLLAVLSLSACDDRATHSPSPSGSIGVAAAPAPSVSSPSVASAAPSAAPSASSAASDAPLELLKMTLTSGVKNRDPVDKLDVVSPGDRVYAHLRLRNRSDAEREITLIFRVNGKVRTTKKLDVEPSWSFRTWGYNTLQDGDTRGELAVTVTDDDGATIAEATLPIRKNPR